MADKKKLMAEWFLTDRWMGSSGFLLPMEARGLYREMLTQAWRRGARLPNDHESIQRACGATSDEWARCWPRVAPFWKVEGSYLVNETQLEVYAESLERHVGASERGKNGADAKKKKRPADTQASLEQNPSDAQAQLEQKPPSPSPSPSLSPSQSPNNDNESPAAGASADKPKVETWASQAADDWLELKGGRPPQIMFALMKPLIREQGWDRVRPPWRYFLANTEAKFLRIDRFTSMFGEWEANANGRLPNGRSARPIPL